MERDRDDRSGFDSLADATGMDEREERPAMSSGSDAPAGETDEATGDERTAVEGAAADGALNAGWGGIPTRVPGGAMTDVPAEEDEAGAGAPDERKDTSDPRGY